MKRKYRLKRLQNGSALVWAIAVGSIIAVIMVGCLGFVGFAAANASERAAEKQNDYLLRSAIAVAAEDMRSYEQSPFIVNEQSRCEINFEGSVVVVSSRKVSESEIELVAGIDGQELGCRVVLSDGVWLERKYF